jgi:fido (protein-threonine AMPylation protein)
LPGAFEASREFDDDPLATAEEIERCGPEVLGWLEALANSRQPRPVDLYLVREIHRRWFETTFPADCGRERTKEVMNRKGTAAAVDAILPALDGACGNWQWRRDALTPDDELEWIAFVVTEANTLTIAVYDVHPFLDGNTRTTFHLRNYLLMLDGLRPLIDLQDQVRYEAAWWDATPHDHEELDSAILEELKAGDR